MAEVLKLLIITPEKEFYNGEIKVLNTTTVYGDIGILPERLPITALLKPTITTFTDVNGNEFKAFTSSGIMEVNKSEIKILCDSCEWPQDIDIERAKRAEKRAEERLSEKTANLDVQRAQLALSRALTRLSIKNGNK